ncbi:MAG: hypothetical protein AAGM21_03860 [Pseudomonadota bacterium]
MVDFSTEDIASLALKRSGAADVQVIAEGGCQIRILRAPTPGGSCIAGSETKVAETVVDFSEVTEIDSAQLEDESYLIVRFDEEVSSHYRALKTDLDMALPNRESGDLVRRTIEDWSSVKIIELSTLDIGTSEQIKQCNGKTRLGILSSGFIIIEVSKELSMRETLASRRLLSSCQKR